MLRLYFLSILTITCLAFICCEKQKVTQPDFATLQMYGWTADFNPVVVNLKEAPLVNYSAATSINSKLLSVYMNKFYITEANQPISFFAFPDTFPSSKPVLKVNLQLQKNEVYSMFLSESASSLDTVLVKDKFPVLLPADSMAAVRFVNLVYDDPISINIKDEPIGSVVQRLPYMGVMDFELFSAKRGRDQYEFEIRNATTQEVIYTHIVHNISGEIGNSHSWYLKIITYAFVGKKNGTGANSLNIQHLYHN